MALSLNMSELLAIIKEGIPSQFPIDGDYDILNLVEIFTKSYTL